MTRTEKYRQYRKEISNMKFESFSQKREASETIEKLQGNRLSRHLNYEQVMDANKVFDEGEVKFKKRRLINLTKYEIFYYIFAISIVLFLIIGLIISGTKLWGN